MKNTKTFESSLLQQAFDQQSASILAARMPASLLLFYGLGGLGTAYEAHYFPERHGALVWIHVVCAVLLVSQIALARILPRYTQQFAVSAAVGMGLALGAYAVMVGLDTEILALTAAIFLLGLLILYPLGWKGQLVAGSGAIASYVVAAYINPPPAVPSVYTASLLWAGYALSALGARVIETHRFQAFAHAARLQNANEGLRQQNSLLLASDEARERLVANASHDLRTPLNVIIGYAQLALDDEFGDLTPELRDAIERIAANGIAQLNLVEDLLTLSRLNLDQMQIRLAAVDVAPLLQDMHAVALNLAQKRPLRVVTTHDSSPPLLVQADADRLRQVLLNLISNAVKYTPDGVIELSANHDGGEVCIRVRDTGVGIDAENIERVFEPFFQISGANGFSSAGLGLAIARRLVEQMGGTIRAEAHPGKGSTFSLRLRRAEALAGASRQSQ